MHSLSDADWGDKETRKGKESAGPGDFQPHPESPRDSMRWVKTRSLRRNRTLLGGKLTIVELSLIRKGGYGRVQTARENSAHQGGANILQEDPSRLSARPSHHEKNSGRPQASTT